VEGNVFFFLHLTCGRRKGKGCLFFFFFKCCFFIVEWLGIGGQGSREGVRLYFIFLIF
jgi:hypothetical protein